MTTYREEYLRPGELWVGTEPCKVRTLLGSCVSVVVHNRVQNFGGMNHFLLPEPLEDKPTNDFRYGTTSTRHLFEQMLDEDPNPDNLVVKLFGGGMVVSALERAGIGRQNVEAARDVIADYGCEVEREYVCNDVGLKLIFENDTNRVLVKRIQSRDRMEEQVRETEDHDDEPLLERLELPEWAD